MRVLAVSYRAQIVNCNCLLNNTQRTENTGNYLVRVFLNIINLFKYHFKISNLLKRLILEKINIYNLKYKITKKI